MKLIVGLGNPDDKYVQTRHNLGFLAINALASKLRVHSSWFIDKKLKSQILKINELSTTNYELVLVKPQTFVNNSGEVVAKVSNFYKIKPENILVIRDDIDLPEGKIRGPKAAAGSGGHKGAESIQKSLKTNSFYQLKIGVGRPPEGTDPADFVLEKLADNNWNEFKKLIDNNVIDKVEAWLKANE